MATQQEPLAQTVEPGWMDALEASIAELGDLSVFAWRTLSWTFRKRPAPGTLLQSFYSVGVTTAPVVIITGLFIGMVLSVQTIATMDQIGLASSIGVSINLTIVRELGPVLVATMLAGRVGSAMAAELATMRVTEQTDALAVLGVNPIHYLVVPRLLACVLLVPLLTVMADFAGIMGGALMSIGFYQVESFYYWKHTEDSLRVWDLVMGLVKPTFFGAAIALICCHRGMNGRGGAEGVGRAATEAFVFSFVVILVLDFFIGLVINTIDTEGARLW